MVQAEVQIHPLLWGGGGGGVLVTDMKESPCMDRVQRHHASRDRGPSHGGQGRGRTLGN